MNKVNGLALGILLACMSLLTAQPLDFLWTQRAGGTSNDHGNAIVSDDQGNTYVAGSFQENSVFGDIVLTSSGIGDFEIFVAKMDSNGNWIWAVSAGGIGYDSCSDICLDKFSNLIITGSFEGPVSSFGSINLTISGSRDLYVAKLDSNGNWLWARGSNGGYNNNSSAVDTDNMSNIYVSGLISSGISLGNISVPCNGSYDIFVAKLDKNGNWMWANSAGSPGPIDEYATGIVVDGSNNVAITGKCGSGAYFGSLEFTGSNYVFVAKLDTNGSWLWVSASGGDANAYSQKISSDLDCNTYVTGHFWDNGILQFGSHVIESSGDDDLFVAKISSSGEWLWAQHASCLLDDHGADICCPDDGYVYVTGDFNGTMYIGDYNLSSSGGADLYVAKLDSNGNWMSVIESGGNGTVNGYGIASDIYSNLYVTGLFSSTAAFGDTSYTASGPYDIFVSKIVNDVPLIEAPLSLNIGYAYLGYYADYQDLYLANVGYEPMIIDSLTISQYPSPFSILSPNTPYTIPPGENVCIEIRYTPQTASVDKDTLIIINNSYNKPIAKICMIATGVIIPPEAPANVQISMMDDDATIGWNEVTSTVLNTPVEPDYYLIFSCDDPYGHFLYHGATSGLQYTLPLAGFFQPRLFFHVIAYKYYGRGIFDISSLGLEPGMPEQEVWRRLRE